MSEQPTSTVPEADTRAGPLMASADNLDVIKKAVEDASSVSGALWISYLAVIVYFAVASLSVTHVDLFLENPVKAPFVGVELPFKAFFVLAPIVFVIIHIYTLTHFVILSDKAKWFHYKLREQIPGDGDSLRDRAAKDMRNRIRRQLPSNILVQFLAGPEDIRESAFGILLKLTAWSTLVVAPVALLLLMQVQILPYHSSALTWTIRFIIITDILLVWWLWQSILVGRGEFKRVGWTARLPAAMGFCVSLFTIGFSCLVATFPGEYLDTKLAAWKPITVVSNEKTSKVSLHDFLFHSAISPATRRRRISLSDTLVLPALNIYEAMKLDESKKIASRQYLFNVRGRDLRGAVFDLSYLPKVDFSFANLEDASFFRARAAEASFYCAKLHGTQFGHAELQAVNFRASILEKAAMPSIEGQGAIFDGALVAGSNFNRADLHGASFNGSDLHQARLRDAHLEGTSFRAAKLDANCNGRLPTPVPQPTLLKGADLTGAVLEGASLAGANLWNAKLDGANFDGADLSGAVLAPADIDRKELAGHSVRRRALVVEGDSQVSDIHPPGSITVRDLEAVACIPTKTIGCRLVGQWEHIRRATSYRVALGKILQNLACTGDPNAVFVLRGLVRNGRFGDQGRKAAANIDFILSDRCSVAASLNISDKAYLLSARREAVADGGR